MVIMERKVGFDGVIHFFLKSNLAVVWRIICKLVKVKITTELRIQFRV